MINPLTTVAVDIKHRTKRARVANFLGALINQITELPANRLAVSIGFNKILLDLRAYRFKLKTQVADNRVEAQNRVIALSHVIDSECHQRQNNQK